MIDWCWTLSIFRFIIIFIIIKISVLAYRKTILKMTYPITILIKADDWKFWFHKCKNI